MLLSPLQKHNRYTIELHKTLMSLFTEAMDIDELLENDELGYEKLQRDAYINGIMRQAKLLTVGQYHSFTPQSDRSKPLVPIMDELLAHTNEDDLQKCLFNLMDSMVKGLAVAKINMVEKWLKMPGDTELRPWKVIDSFQAIDKRRIRRLRDRDLEGKAVWRWSIYDYEIDQWVMMDNTSDYIWHFYDTPEGYTKGRGLGGSLFYYWFAKTVLFEMMQEGAERWANGWTVAYIDGLKRQTNNAFPNRATTQKWLDALDTMVGGKSMVMSADDRVEVIPGPSQGHQIITDSLRYLDEAISMLLLSGNLPMLNQGGSYALADIKQDEQQSGPIQYNRISLAGAFSKHAIHNNLWRRNLPNLRAMGLGELLPPRFVLANQKVFDPNEELSIVTAGTAAGLSFKKSEVYERIGYAIPDPSDTATDNIIGPPAEPAATMGGIPGFFAKRGLEPVEELERISATPKKLNAQLKDMWRSLTASQVSGSPVPVEKLNDLVDSLQKLQVFGDIQGRKRLVQETKAQGVTPEEIENGNV